MVLAGSSGRTAQASGRAAPPASVLAARGPLGLVVFPARRAGAGLACGCGSRRAAREPAPRVKAGAARAHEGRGAARGGGRAQSGQAEQDGAPRPGARTRTPTPWVPARPLPALPRAQKAKSTGHGGGGRSSATRLEPVRVLADPRGVDGVGGRSAPPSRASHPLPPGPRGGCSPGAGEALPRAPHPLTGRRLTHTRPGADKGVLCLLPGREGVCDSAATGLWRPRSPSAPQRPRTEGAAAGPRERHPRRPGPPAPAWLGL